MHAHTYTHTHNPRISPPLSVPKVAQFQSFCLQGQKVCKPPRYIFPFLGPGSVSRKLMPHLRVPLQPQRTNGLLLGDPPAAHDHIPSDSHCIPPGAWRDMLSKVLLFHGVTAIPAKPLPGMNTALFAFQSLQHYPQLGQRCLGPVSSQDGSKGPPTFKKFLPVI